MKTHLGRILQRALFLFSAVAVSGVLLANWSITAKSGSYDDGGNKIEGKWVNGVSQKGYVEIYITTDDKPVHSLILGLLEPDPQKSIGAPDAKPTVTKNITFTGVTYNTSGINLPTGATWRTGEEITIDTGSIAGVGFENSPNGGSAAIAANTSNLLLATVEYTVTSTSACLTPQFPPETEQMTITYLTTGLGNENYCANTTVTNPPDIQFVGNPYFALNPEFSTSGTTIFEVNQDSSKTISAADFVDAGGKNLFIYQEWDNSTKKLVDKPVVFSEGLTIAGVIGSSEGLVPDSYVNTSDSKKVDIETFDTTEGLFSIQVVKVKGVGPIDITSKNVKFVVKAVNKAPNLTNLKLYYDDDAPGVYEGKWLAVTINYNDDATYWGDLNYTSSTLSDRDVHVYYGTWENRVELDGEWESGGQKSDGESFYIDPLPYDLIKHNKDGSATPLNTKIWVEVKDRGKNLSNYEPAADNNRKEAVISTDVTFNDTNRAPKAEGFTTVLDRGASIALSDANPVITASYSATSVTDPDGDPITYTYEWSVWKGSSQVGTPTAVSGHPDQLNVKDCGIQIKKNYTIKATAKASDTIGASVAASQATMNIANSLPVLAAGQGVKVSGSTNSIFVQKEPGDTPPPNKAVKKKVFKLQFQDADGIEDFGAYTVTNPNTSKFEVAAPTTHDGDFTVTIVKTSSEFENLEFTVDVVDKSGDPSQDPFIISVTYKADPPPVVDNFKVTSPSSLSNIIEGNTLTVDFDVADSNTAVSSSGVSSVTAVLKEVGGDVVTEAAGVIETRVSGTYPTGSAKKTLTATLKLGNEFIKHPASGGNYELQITAVDGNGASSTTSYDFGQSGGLPISDVDRLPDAAVINSLTNETSGNVFTVASEIKAGVNLGNDPDDTDNTRRGFLYQFCAKNAISSNQWVDLLNAPAQITMDDVPSASIHETLGLIFSQKRQYLYKGTKVKIKFLTQSKPYNTDWVSAASWTESSEITIGNSAPGKFYFRSVDDIVDREANSELVSGATVIQSTEICTSSESHDWILAVEDLDCVDQINSVDIPHDTITWSATLEVNGNPYSGKEFKVEFDNAGLSNVYSVSGSSGKIDYAEAQVRMKLTCPPHFNTVHGRTLKITVTATDDDGASNSCVIPVNIEAVNDPPVLDVKDIYILPDQAGKEVSHKVYVKSLGDKYEDEDYFADIDSIGKSDSYLVEPQVGVYTSPESGNIASHSVTQWNDSEVGTGNFKENAYISFQFTLNTSLQLGKTDEITLYVQDSGKDGGENVGDRNRNTNSQKLKIYYGATPWYPIIAIDDNDCTNINHGDHSEYDGYTLHLVDMSELDPEPEAMLTIRDGRTSKSLMPADYVAYGCKGYKENAILRVGVYPYTRADGTFLKDGEGNDFGCYDLDSRETSWKEIVISEYGLPQAPVPAGTAEVGANGWVTFPTINVPMSKGYTLKIYKKGAPSKGVSPEDTLVYQTKADFAPTDDSGIIKSEICGLELQILEDGDYYTFIQGYNPNGNGPEDASACHADLEFTIGSGSEEEFKWPDNPAMNPVNGKALYNNEGIKFSWPPISGAVQYTLTVLDSKGTTVKKQNVTGVTYAVIDLPATSGIENYNWYVAAQNSSGEEIYTEYVKLSLYEAADGLPVITGVAANSGDGGATALLTFEGVSDVVPDNLAFDYQYFSISDNKWYNVSNVVPSLESGKLVIAAPTSGAQAHTFAEGDYIVIRYTANGELAADWSVYLMQSGTTSIK